MTHQTNTTSQWMQKVNDNAADLRQLVVDYHPAMMRRQITNMPITAPNAELACQNVRDKIREETKLDPARHWE